MYFILGAIRTARSLRPLVSLAWRFSPGLSSRIQPTAAYQVSYQYRTGLGFSYVPSVGAVQPWFVEKRGFASGSQFPVLWNVVRSADRERFNSSPTGEAPLSLWVR